MNNFEKLKRKTTLGVPPSIDQVKNNLALPEVIEDNIVDGRTLRKTGRVHQLATRVTYTFYRKIKMIAARDNIKIAELLERSIDLYEKEFERNQ